MQVDPIKPTLKAPRTERLKLKYDEPLSSFAFNFNSCRYSEVVFGETSSDEMCQVGRYRLNR